MVLRRLLLGVAALAAGTVAQEATTGTTTTSAASSTSSSAAPTHSISVGAEGFKFSPNEITNASVGDWIEWRFYPTGHSVVRGGFKNPCIPYERTGPNLVGFWSGFEDVQTVSNNPPVFRVRINDTEPIFFYCSAPGSCTDQHMIGVINPNATWTLAIQEEFVQNATFQLSPGEAFPSETASATATPTSGSTSSSDSDSNSHHSHLSAGAIAGIAIGAAAVLVLAGALIYLCGRRGGLDKAYRHSRVSMPPPPMVEAKFDPKSPGQETFTTTHYSMPPGNDPYRHGTQSPPIGYPVAVSPPPGSPGYAPFPSPGHQVNSPLMGVDGNSTLSSPGYYMPQQTPPPPQQPPQPPVELPTFHDPGNSPLPTYTPSRQYSWAQDTETGYRPGAK
ncbi:hypothetical protein NKR23_g651 [Pleurostoma richardsiae]|uniref:Extracellular serine-rich protein n=1 Tax=Pleurostoma richardsiae TaxID=41990 RepID=A0AA38S7U3_9PEZI|nr:hypothetical protein NKR23_g651 [Pleurostoma richardsiae]